jgi:hypothetical protein
MLSMAGCSTSPGRSLFVTKCGVTLMGDVWPDEWTPEELQANEDRLIERFATHVTDKRFKTACERLEATTLWVRPDPHWIDELGRDVWGLTSCAARRIQVGRSLVPVLSTMGHEYAHIIQNCEAYPPVDKKEDPAHANWVRDRIYFAAGAGSL